MGKSDEQSVEVWAELDPDDELAERVELENFLKALALKLFPAPPLKDEKNLKD